MLRITPQAERPYYDAEGKKEEKASSETKEQGGVIASLPLTEA
jgi:hypothetical protein